MKCNACWGELEGQAVSTTCGHLFCLDGACNTLLTNKDAPCPICDQVLTESCMKLVDINPNDEWTNVLNGLSPETTLMKSAYKGVMFYVGQEELEMQYKMNRLAAQCQQQCEAMQEKFTENMEQVHTAYQKMAKRCQMMEHEIESLSKDKQELQEKIAEKSRQKIKLDEMYDQLRSEFESVKRSGTRAEHDLFSNPPYQTGYRDPPKRDRSFHTPQTSSQRDGMSAVRRPNRASSLPYHFSKTTPAIYMGGPVDSENRSGVRPVFGAGATVGASNPSMIPRDRSFHTPQTSSRRDGMWAAPPNRANSLPYHFSKTTPAKYMGGPVDAENRSGVRPVFGAGATAGASNPSMTRRNKILLPNKRPPLST